VDGLCVHEVRHAVSGPTINGGIEVWPSCGERLARNLHRLWGDGVLRAWNPDGQNHDRKVKRARRYDSWRVALNKALELIGRWR
jgi:hypothetical protein